MTANAPFAWLDLETVPREVFTTPPITIVICQIRYGQLISLTPQTIEKFHERIFDDFPDAREDNGIIEFTGIAKGPRIATGQAWRFADLEDNWAVTISAESMAIETRKYTDYSEFNARLSRVLKALETVVRPKLCTRIGLRYINEIRDSDQDWNRIIRNELLGIIGSPPLADSTYQAVEQVILVNGEDRISFNHGLLPSGSVVSPRPNAATINSPFYLLDIDVYRDYSGSNRFDIRHDKVIRIIDDFHEGASKLFRWSITNGFSDQARGS